MGVPRKRTIVFWGLSWGPCLFRETTFFPSLHEDKFAEVGVIWFRLRFCVCMGEAKEGVGCRVYIGFRGGERVEVIRRWPKARGVLGESSRF